MIGLAKDIMPLYENNIVSFTNFDLIDTSIAFEEARKKIDFLIPEFTRYINGDRRKSKVYGNIKKFHEEEIMFINDNVFESNSMELKNLDNVIEDSCVIYRDLRVVILKENVNLSSITGYDMITFSRHNIDDPINTVFIQDMKINTKTAISICLKLFDRILISYLHKYNIPITGSKFVSLIYDGANGFKLSRFIYDYFGELLYPFTKKIIIEDKDLSDIAFQLSRANFEILSEDQIIELFNFIKQKDEDTDKFDYIELVARYQQSLEGKNLFTTDN